LGNDEASSAGGGLGEVVAFGFKQEMRTTPAFPFVSAELELESIERKRERRTARMWRHCYFVISFASYRLDATSVQSLLLLRPAKGSLSVRCSHQEGEGENPAPRASDLLRLD
jgi:hypothetical protein